LLREGQECSTYPPPVSRARKGQRKAPKICFQTEPETAPDEDAYRIVCEYLRSEGFSASLESSSFMNRGPERIKLYLGSKILHINVVGHTTVVVFFSPPVIIRPASFDLHHPDSLRDLAKALRNASNIE
jgi:hypothetical protein